MSERIPANEASPPPLLDFVGTARRSSRTVIEQRDPHDAGQRSTVTTTFVDLGVPAALAADLRQRGITEPTPIQAATIPDALRGRDICGRAPTGSGKTIAYGIPLVVGLPDRASKHPVALVLVPTRELCAQVAAELDPLVRLRGTRVVAIYGGVAERAQRRALATGATVVVACPGRLEDLFAQGALRLDQVSHVVVDEADRMADMGFLPAVRRIVDATSTRRQTQLFSATLGGQVAALVEHAQVRPVRHEVGRDEGTLDTAATHAFWAVERADRVTVTADLVNAHGSTIVFTRTRHGASRLAAQLGKKGVSAVELHGGRTQGQRDRALASFTDGRSAALVATDVAARGIHVDDVACVVHFDLPEDADTYIHRSGRTARAGLSGAVVALVGREKRKEAAALQRALLLDAGLAAPTFPQRSASKPAAARRADSARSAEPSRGDGRPARSVDRDQRPRLRAGSAPKRSTTPKPRAMAAGSAASRGRKAHASLGHVKFFNAKMGYGFIARDRADDLFVHHTNIAGEGQGALREGQAVEFAIAAGRKGDEAVDVRVV